MSWKGRTQHHRRGSSFYTIRSNISQQRYYFSSAIILLGSVAYLFSCVASPISGPYFYYLCFSGGDSFAGKTKWTQSVIIRKGAHFLFFCCCFFFFFLQQGCREMCLHDSGRLSRLFFNSPPNRARPSTGGAAFHPDAIAYRQAGPVITSPLVFCAHLCVCKKK